MLMVANSNRKIGWFDLDLLAGDWNPSSDLGIQ
jgi:hypothetical protein